MIVIRDGTASGATNDCLSATAQGVIEARGVTATNAGRHGAFADRNGQINMRLGDVRGAVNDGVRLVSGMICTRDATISDANNPCGERAIYARSGILEANGATATDAGNSGAEATTGAFLAIRGADISGATTPLKADGAAIVDASNATVDNSAGGFATNIKGGSTVSLSGASIQGNSGGAQIEAGASANLQGATCINSGGDIILADGAIVNASNCTTGGSTDGTPDPNDINVSHQQSISKWHRVRVMLWIGMLELKTRVSKL